MIRRAQPWLGTVVDIALPAAAPAAGSADAAFAAITDAFAEIALVHRLMSFHDPASDVSRINRAAPGESIPVHAHTLTVLRLAERFWSASHGIFNIACAPRLVAWGKLPALQDEAPSYVPGQSVIACTASGLVRKMAPGWIDLGGIAKGYAVDLAIASLRHAGIASACVNAGGDLRVLGGAPFTIAIRSPRDPRHFDRHVDLHDGALATSASYFSNAVIAGQNVSALVDGRNGQALTAALSVTVQAPSCVEADALTKIVLSSSDPQHPALHACGATAFII
jgi:thiamine biosynthesis lipoprotein